MAEETAPEQEMQTGFALALTEQRSRNQEVYGKTHHGLWVPMRDLVPIRASIFRGESLPQGALNIAWSIDDATRVFSKPNGQTRAKTTLWLRRFLLLRILEEKDNGETFYRFGENQWVRARDVRRPHFMSAPSEIQPGERWIDVELSTQTLVAYEGARPVYATLVSTGRGGQGTAYATPKGLHRIWVKLVSSTMDNLENETAASYALEDVPYVQFFSKGVGLHGVFWHQNFGRVRSHGCINLAPLDAQWLFAFTGPTLPVGWSAVLPISGERGTLVRVR